jgi:hypothetical protein
MSVGQGFAMHGMRILGVLVLYYFAKPLFGAFGKELLALVLK